MRFALKRAPELLSVTIDGRRIEIAVRRNPRARRLTLRLDSAEGGPVVTLPARVALAEGQRFLDRHAGWLAERLERLPPPIPFADGACFPFRGMACRVSHRGGRGIVRLDATGGEPVLQVPGEAAHLSRRLGDWLKREARRDLAAAVARHAEAVGRRPRLIRIGDARSRWGSCTAAGVLTFSWRLVLAPPAVLDYLAAHEVAHLVEMNHGRRFWKLVAELDPDFEAARRWLKRHGAALQAVGRGA